MGATRNAVGSSLLGTNTMQDAVSNLISQQSHTAGKTLLFTQREHWDRDLLQAEFKLL